MESSVINREKWTIDFRSLIFFTTFFTFIFFIYITISIVCYEYLLLTYENLLWFIIVPGIFLIIPIVPLFHILCKYPDWYFDSPKDDEYNNKWYNENNDRWY